MIPVNFSITNRAACFIHQQRDTKTENPFLRFTQREIVTRVIGIALPILSLFDVVYHTVGMAEGVLKGIVDKTDNFEHLQHHYKCVKIFFRFIWLSLFYGSAIPSILLTYFEDETISCVNALLLSQNPEYSENCVVDCLKIVKFIKKHTDRMDPEDLAGMESSLKLLDDAKKYLKMNDFQKSRDCTQIRTTHSLCKITQTLRKTQGSFIKTFFFKECLTRLISLGLSITSAIDLTINIFTTAFFLFSVSIVRLLFGKKYLLHSSAEGLQYLIANFRDTIIHLAGTLTASVVGVINPDVATKLADPSSSWYRKLAFDGEYTTDVIIKDLEKLEDGESILIPLSFQTEDSGHIVYCLVDKKDGAYDFTTLNTGYGANYAEAMLITLTGLRSGLSEKEAKAAALSSEGQSEKRLSNYTFRNLTFGQVSSQVKSIQKLVHQSFWEMEQKGEENKLTAEEFTLSTIYPAYLENIGTVSFPETGRLNSFGLPELSMNSELMFSKPQAIGDCPKSSLLTALNYHSSHKSKAATHQPYDLWVRRLRDRVFDQNGYLIDLSLSLKNHDRKARVTARECQENSWLKYTARYCTV